MIPTRASAGSRGYLLSFEGGEGGGKGTQIANLVMYLKALGYPITETREPGGTLIGNDIRGILLNPKHAGMDYLTELLLYEATRAQLLREVIRPALSRGEIVICDRFADSTTVYQGDARGIDLQIIGQLNQIATNGLRPDYTVLLDLDPIIGLQRIQKRGTPDRLEQEALTFHQRVRQGYLRLAKQEPDRFLVIDASENPTQIQATIRTALITRLCQATWRPKPPDLRQIDASHGGPIPCAATGCETEPCPTIRAAQAHDKRP